MRYFSAAIIAIFAISATAFAGTKAEETKSKSEDTKIEMNKQNAKLAALSSSGNASASQTSTSNQNKTTKVGSEQTQSDNVQGLATSDRRYRYND